MVYLDANATSSLRPEARQAVERLLEADNTYLNPSSVHQRGQAARAHLEEARAQILNFTFEEAYPAELFFTSGGTEACNTIINAFLGNRKELHIVTSAIEHAGVLEPLRASENQGAKVSYVKPNADGIIDVEHFVSAVTPDTALVCLMAANNEVGSIQPIIEIAKKLRETGYHMPIVSDFTQAFGKSDLRVKDLFDAGVNAIAISGHKLGALPGIGAVIINKNTTVCFPFETLLKGGPQEKRFRAGTENVFGGVSFGAACKALKGNASDERARRRFLRDYFWKLLAEEVGEVICLTPGVGTNPEQNLCNTLSVRFKGCRADDLVVALDINGVTCSLGAACSSGKQEVSEVILALGLSKEEAKEVVRFSLDWDTDREGVERAVSIIANLVSSMREAGYEYAAM